MWSGSSGYCTSRRSLSNKHSSSDCWGPAATFQLSVALHPARISSVVPTGTAIAEYDSWRLFSLLAYESTLFHCHPYGDVPAVNVLHPWMPNRSGNKKRRYPESDPAARSATFYVWASLILLLLGGLFPCCAPLWVCSSETGLSRSTHCTNSSGWSSSRNRANSQLRCVCSYGLFVERCWSRRETRNRQPRAKYLLSCNVQRHILSDTAVPYDICLLLVE